MFIHVKFARALDGLIDRQEEDYEELVDDDGVPFPRDSDGSAKIAIIAIERSFNLTDPAARRSTYNRQNPAASYTAAAPARF